MHEAEINNLYGNEIGEVQIKLFQNGEYIGGTSTGQLPPGGAPVLFSANTQAKEPIEFQLEFAVLISILSRRFARGEFAPPKNPATPIKFNIESENLIVFIPTQEEKSFEYEG